MACKFIIKPRTGPNAGKEVESKLYTDLVNITGSEKAADEAYSKVHNPEFLRWFGDWIGNKGSVSKVVDENGEPLMVYRFTQKEEEIFTDKGKEYGPMGAAKGIHFTDQIEMEFGPTLTPVFLNIQNLKNIPAWDIAHITPEAKSQFTKEGVDGVATQDSATSEREGDTPFSEVAVWNSNQIKHATENVGEFSLDPNIKQQKLNYDLLLKSDNQEKIPMRVMQGVLERLQKRFGIQYKIINDKKNLWKGKFQQGVAVVNLAYATMDTAFHEVAHPWVDAIRKGNKPLYTKLVEEIIAEDKVLAYIKRKYPELSLEDQIDEAIVEAIGRYAGKSVTSEGSPLIDVIQKLMKYLRRVWKQFMNKDYIIKPGDLSAKTPLQLLGYYMVYGNAKIQTAESNFMSSTQVRISDILNGIDKKQDIESIDDLTTRFQKLEEVGNENEKKMEPGLDIVAELERISDTENLKLTKDQKLYKGNNSEYERNTSFISKEFGVDPDLRTSEKISLSIFENYRKDIETDKITLNGVEYTYKELVVHFNKNSETAAAYGSVIHKMMQIHLTRKKVEDKKIPESVLVTLQQELQELMRAKGNQEQIEQYQVNWLDQLKDVYLKILGVTDADNIGAEVMLHSPIMGVATQIDGLVQKPDGSLHMVDWKSGSRFYTSDSYAEYMPYASGATSDIYNTKLNRAKLEMAIRAIMIKESIPSAKFSKIVVHHLDRTNIKQEPETVHLTDFLPIVGEYFKKNNIDVYNKLKAKGLLDVRNYITTDENNSKDIFIKGNSMPAKEKADFYRLHVERLNNRLSMNQSTNRAKDEQDLAEITDELMKSEQLTKEDLDGSETLGLFKTWVGTLWNVKSKRLQTYTKMWGTHHKAYMEDKFNEMHAYMKYVDDIKSEYMNKNPMKQAASAITSRQLNLINTRDMWSFFWVYRDSGIQNAPGYYAKTLAEAKTEFNAGKLTKAQYDIIEYMNKRQNEMFNKVSSKTAYVDKFGRKQTVSDMLGIANRTDVTKDGKLAEYFAPRLPASQSEMLERYEGQGGVKYWKRTKDSFKDWRRRNLTFYHDKVYQEDYVTAGNLIPISYLGNSSIISSEEHSFDVERMHLEFMNSLFKKNQMDPALAFAQGLKGWYQFRQRQKMGTKQAKHFKRFEQFMENEIMVKILNRKMVDTDWASNDLTISNPFDIDQKTGEPKKMKLNIYQAMMAVKNLRTGVALWLRVGGGTFNGAIITMYTLASALKGSIAKRIGIPESAIDFTMGDIAFGAREVSKYFGSQIAGTRHKNKLYNLMSRFNYLPDNYDYAIDKSDLKSYNNPGLRYGNLFFFHAIHEEWGHAILLAAQLKKLKHQGDGSSIWDNYDNMGKWKEYKKDPETGKQKYNVRFIKKEAGGKQIAVTDLEVEEIQRMYAVSTLLHGGYRRHERTLMEANALGSWFLQFKKYLPSLLASAWQSKQRSQALGWYENWHENGPGDQAANELADKNGNRPADLKTMTVVDSEGNEIQVEANTMEWVSAVHNGRAKIVMGMLMRIISFGKVGDRYAWANLSPRDKEGFVDFATKSLALANLLVLSQAVAEGDGDEAEFYGMKTGFLAHDMMQGYNPLEIIRTAKLPFASIQMVSDFSAAFLEVMGSGVIGGKRTRDGLLPGQLQLMKNTPFWSVQYELDRYGMIK